ncbi:MAG: GNAT family N-acetyltransferase [Betaproteobacteria bacterium]|nr:GNAT family N-acetyltransferase [Betaproteobacteria bacterium]MDE2003166.1 GNAT family N-acetyltransferase [Betaproteobacteria bacterium]MDE2210767.1 GNAT family N-acetyltransferase [Betaproteobacteria bacterium]MDE2357892.1 GNAT family N-acetyltransferase [Betaproteobacteria bacterium]
MRVAAGAVDLASARRLFEAYAASLAVDLCFQGFAAELAGLPGEYAAPRGRLLLVRGADADVGCVALRPLRGDVDAHDDAAPADIGEVKRLYVDPAARGCGLGRSLMDALIAQARGIGYRELRLDTLATMGEARALYASLGFRECERYCDNPLPGAAWMALALA